MRRFPVQPRDEMPEERDIGKKLRAAAAERRQAAGGPFALHPATRRLLQGAVARTRPAAAGSAPRKFFPGLTWLRFASGVGTVGILCFGIWVWLRHTPPPTRPSVASAPAPAQEHAAADKAEAPAFYQPAVAPREEAKKAKEQLRPATPPAELLVAAAAPPPAPTAPAAPVPAAAPASGADDADLRMNKAGAGKFDLAKAEGSAAPETSRGKTVAVHGDHLLRSVQPGASETLALTKPHVLAKDLQGGPGGTFAAVGKREQAAAQSFAYRNEPISGKARKAPAVLASFNVSQSGDRIRIEDSDGSVYEGGLLAETPFPDAAAPAAELKETASANTVVAGTFSVAAGAPSPAPAINDAVGDRRYDTSTFRNNSTFDRGAGAEEASGGVRFNAAGTNVALRQNVVITGTFVNAAPADREGVSNEAGRRLQSQNRAALVPQSRIIGRAVTADGREIQLNAAPVAP